MAETDRTRGGKRDNRKKRADDRRGGYRGGAPLKRHYVLSEEAARIVRDAAKRDGVEREDWLNQFIMTAPDADRAGREEG